MTITTSVIIFLIGRIIFGGYFAMSGFNHFKNGKKLAGYAASKKVPMSGAAVYFSGLLILFGGIGIILNAYPAISLALIIAFLLPVSFMMHSYWKISDPMVKMTEMTHFLKNMVLVGASFMLISLILS
ncbi:MAG: DoxX family protein [Patescibacteria group bacterium]|nr:DoxX family protein [Patescibacteria group bacterium]